MLMAPTARGHHIVSDARPGTSSVDCLAPRPLVRAADRLRSTRRSPRALHASLTRGGRAAQITSLFLHWMPACVVWTLRWYPHRSTRLNFDAKSVEAKERWHHGSLLDLVVLPVLPYLLWAVAYYIKVTMPEI